jgi:hypothetical protein
LADVTSEWSDSLECDQSVVQQVANPAVDLQQDAAGSSPLTCQALIDNHSVAGEPQARDPHRPGSTMMKPPQPT